LRPPRRPPGPRPDRWRFWDSISALPEAAAVVGLVTDAMAREGYPDKDSFGMRLALEEAVVNAVKHGNGGDPAKWVVVRFTVSPERVLAEVQDEGAGFDPARVPDPTAPENRQRPGGRGLLLIRTYATGVRYNAAGNCVTLCKRRCNVARPIASEASLK
jgi:serine/threonine-protein kinase RsbW